MTATKYRMSWILMTENLVRESEERNYEEKATVTMVTTSIYGDKKRTMYSLGNMYTDNDEPA